MPSMKHPMYIDSELDELPGDGLPHPGRRMTESEFFEWIDDVTHAEWVDGEVILFAPGECYSNDIQFNIRSILTLLADMRELGSVHGGRYQIRLASQKSRRMADVYFVTKERQNILQTYQCEGPPDLIVEVVDPDSVARDWREKFFEYAAAGVREYWIVDPRNEIIEANELTAGGKYRSIVECNGKICSKVLDGFYLRPEWMLKNRFPKLKAILKEWNVEI